MKDLDMKYYSIPAYIRKNSEDIARKAIAEGKSIEHLSARVQQSYKILLERGF